MLQVKGQLLPNLSQACNSSRLRITHMWSCSGKNHSEIHIPCTTFMSGFNALCLQHNNVRASNEQIVLHISDTPEHTVVPSLCVQCPLDKLFCTPLHHCVPLFYVLSALLILLPMCAHHPPHVNLCVAISTTPLTVSSSICKPLVRCLVWSTTR